MPVTVSLGSSMRESPMQFEVYRTTSIPSEVGGFIREHLDLAPRRCAHAWALLGDGGRLNRYTEELEGREPIAAMVLYNPTNAYDYWLALAVHPDHRRQGWGSKLLRWYIEEYTSAQALVPVDNEAAMALANKFGTRESGNYEVVRFHLSTTTFRHAGCRCSFCREDMAVFRGWTR